MKPHVNLKLCIAVASLFFAFGVVVIDAMPQPFHPGMIFRDDYRADNPRVVGKDIAISHLK